MPVDRFVIQFDTNYRAAIAALDALGNKVSEIERRINSLNQRTGGAGGGVVQTFNAMGQAGTQAAQGVNRLGQAMRAGFNASDISKFRSGVQGIKDQLAALERERRTFARSGTVFPDSKLLQMIRLYEQLGATGTRSLTSVRTSQERLARDLSDPSKFFPNGLSVGLNRTAGEIRKFQGELAAAERGIARRAIFGRQPTESQLGRALSASLALQERGFVGAAAAVDKYTNALNRGQFVADNASRAFGFHARRIAEGILIYEAFSQAVLRATQAISFVADTDREIQRLSQVLGGLEQSEADAFMERLGQIAFDTNTPMGDLVSTTDLLAGVLKDLEGDVLTNVEAFQELAGAFSNVLGPNQNQEAVTGQLVQIFRALDFQSVQEFEDFLDFLVTSGNKSAFEIENIFNALAEVAPNAKLASLDVNLLALALDNLVRNTPASGTELGNIFKTALGRFLNESDQEDIQEVFDSISGGFLQIKDASGNVKPATQVFLEMVAAFKEGIITAEEADKVFSQLVGPLQPGQIGVVSSIFEAFVDAAERVPQVAAESQNALEKLSDALVDTLAGRFGQFIRRLEQGLVASQHVIEEFANALLGVGEAILNVIGFLGADFFITLGKIGLVLGGLKLLQVVRDSHLLRSALGLVRDVGAGVSLVMGQMAATSGGLGAKLRAGAAGARVLAGGFATLAASVGVLALELAALVAVFAAVQFAMNALDEAGKIDLLKDAGLGQFAEEALHGRLGSPEGRASLGAGRGVGTSAAGATIEGTLTDVQRENLLRLAQALKEAEEAGTLTEASMESMKGAILRADGTVKTLLVSIDDIRAGTDSATSSTQNLTTAQIEHALAAAQAADANRRLAESEQEANDIAKQSLLLAEDRVAALEDLDARLSAGDITQRQYAEGVDQVKQASDLAAEASIKLGDILGRIPQLEAAAAGGADTLTRALFNQFIQSTDNIDVIQRVIQRIIALAAAHDAVARHIALNPILIQAVILPPVTSPTTGNKVGKRVTGGALEPGQFNAGFNPGSISSQIDRLLGELGRLFSFNSSSTFGTGFAGTGGSGSRGTAGNPVTVRMADTIDIGDLSRSQVRRIIEIAQQLRGKIPGAREESRGDVVSILKDGRFLRNVRGIDERLLRIAIDRLTKQIERQNELEERKAQRDNILRNLVVNAGPLSALVSQPTAFGVGGNLAAGNGLNFNPQQGNFVINVPVELKGLSPKALQTLIYNIIAKAIRDALRL